MTIKKKLFIIIISSAVSILCLEAVIRFFFGSPTLNMDDDWHYYHQIYEPLSKPFFLTKKIRGISTVGFARSYAHMGMLSRKKPFRKKKDDGEIRIIVIGESVAELFGSGLTHNSYIQKMLSTRFPGRNINVINAGIGAYTSPHVHSIAKELVKLEPDIVLLLMGNNIYSEYDLSTWRMLRNPPAFRFLYRNSMLYRKFYEALRSFGKEGNYGVSQFKDDYTDIINLFRKQSIDLVLFTLPGDFSDYPPVNNISGIHVLPRLLIEMSRYERAIQVLSEYDDPYSLFLKADALKRAGYIDQAAEIYLNLMDSLPNNRTTRPLNQFIRGISKESSSVLVEIDQLFIKMSENGLLGNNFFRNQCHWHKRLNIPIAKELTRQMNSRTIAGVKPTDTLHSLEYPSKEAFTDDVSLYMGNIMTGIDMALETDHGSFAHISLLSIYYFRKAAIINPEFFFKKIFISPEEYIAGAAKQSDSVLARAHIDESRIKENWHRVLSFAGEAFRLNGHNEYTEKFLEYAIELSPKSPEPHFFISLLEASGENILETKKRLDFLKKIGHPLPINSIYNILIEEE